MKKLTRMVCLVAALVLSGFATAGAWPMDGYVTCYYSYGYGTIPVTTEVGHCCGTQIQHPDNSTGYALRWEQMGLYHYCMI